MLAITGAQRSTPTKVLEMVLGLVPIDLHVKSLGYMSFHHSKCLDLAGWDGIGNGNKRGHRLLWEKLGINALTNRLDPDDCIKSINFDINIEAVDVRNATASNIGIIKVIVFFVFLDRSGNCNDVIQLLNCSALGFQQRSISFRKLQLSCCRRSFSFSFILILD